MTQRGQPCRQAPLTEGDHCFWHSPLTKAEAAEARRLGGLRSRREHTLAGVYEYGGLADIASIRRLVEIAVVDTLGLDNSLGRSRTLGYLAGVAVKLLEVGELEERLQSVEAAVKVRPLETGAIFDADRHDRAIVMGDRHGR